MAVRTAANCENQYKACVRTQVRVRTGREWVWVWVVIFTVQLPILATPCITLAPVKALRRDLVTPSAAIVRITRSAAVATLSRANNHTRANASVEWTGDSAGKIGTSVCRKVWYKRPFRIQKII